MRFLKSKPILALTIFGLVVILGHEAFSESWFKSPLKREGFFWGTDIEKKDKKKEDKKEKPDPQKDESKKQTPGEILLALQKEEKEKHEKLIIQPTEENAREYLKAKNKLTKLAIFSSDIVTKVQKIDPEFNARNITQMPSGAYGQKLYEDRKKKEAKAKVDQFAKDHMMLFFFSEKCDESIRQAVTIYAISKELNMPIMAYSKEGNPMYEFPIRKMDYAFLKKMGVKKLPTVLFVKTHSKKKYPTVSFALQGYKVIDEVLDAICAYVDLEKMKEKKEKK